MESLGVFFCFCFSFLVNEGRCLFRYMLFIYLLTSWAILFVFITLFSLLTLLQMSPFLLPFAHLHPDPPQPPVNLMHYSFSFGFLTATRLRALSRCSGAVMWWPALGKSLQCKSENSAKVPEHLIGGNNENWLSGYWMTSINTIDIERTERLLWAEQSGKTSWWMCSERLGSQNKTTPLFYGSICSCPMGFPELIIMAEP